MGEARFDTEIQLKLEMEMKTKQNKFEMLQKYFKIDKQMDKTFGELPLEKLSIKS